MPETSVLELAIGDTFDREHYDQQRDSTAIITVTILGEAEPWKDLFGRDMIKFWASRSDTKAEGWYSFGPQATVNLTNR